MFKDISKHFNIVIGFLFLATLAEAKCRGWDYGSPNFCVSLKIIELMSVS